MAGRETKIVTGDDDDREGAAPTNGAAHGAAGAEPEFTIIETDNDFRPLAGGSGEGEGRLTEAEEGEGPLIQAGEGDEAQQREQPQRHVPRAKRNARKQEGRDRTLAKLSAVESENDALRRKLDELQGTVTGKFQQFDETQRTQRIQQLDGQIQEQANAAAQALRDLSAAIADGTGGDAVATALQKRDVAILAGQRLQVQKNMLETGNPTGERTQRREAEPATDQQRQQQPQTTVRPYVAGPQEKRYVAQFQAENPWMNTEDGRDDAEVMLALDRAVARAGFDPNTQDYWDELNERARTALPDRFAEDDGGRADNGAGRQQPQRQQRQQPQPQRRGPAVGGGSDRPANVPKNAVYMSPERKESMILAGVLDRDGRTVINKDKYTRIMRSYQEFDRTNQTSGAARQ